MKNTINILLKYVGGLLNLEDITFKKYSYKVQSGEEVTININVKGCYIVSADITSSITFFLYSRNSNPVLAEIKTLGNVIGYTNDKTIYIKAETGNNIIIKNNHTAEINVFICETKL